MPSEIDYDVLSQNVGGVIVRVHSGAQAKKENAATYLNGLDKSFKTHIQEFQKRNIPVAVYALSLIHSEMCIRDRSKIFQNLLDKPSELLETKEAKSNLAEPNC